MVWWLLGMKRLNWKDIAVWMAPTSCGQHASCYYQPTHQMPMGNITAKLSKDLRRESISEYIYVGFLSPL